MKHINFKHSDEAIAKILKTKHAFDISIYFYKYDSDEKRRIIDLLDQQKLSDMFILLDVESQWEILELLSENRKKALLRNLESDDLKEFIASLDEDRWVTLTVSAAGLRTINKVGIHNAIQKAQVNGIIGNV